MSEIPIAVFVHVHYPEIWRTISERLSQRLYLPFHLVLTSSQAEGTIILPKTRALLSVKTLLVENRGRDILPFLRALADTGGFDLGLKLHTKKSPQRADGAQWLSDILDSLLPSSSGLNAIVAHMQADSRIGFVAPAGFCLSVKPWILQNAPGMSSIMTAIGVNLVERDLDDTYFAAGSMFWFRRSALAELTDERLTRLFEAEEGQSDGTIAHAMERIFPVAARRRGFVSLAVPALTSSTPAMTTADLFDLARRHADIPSRYFPGPYIPASPHALATEEPREQSWLKTTLSRYYSTLPLGLRGILRNLRGS